MMSTQNKRVYLTNGPARPAPLPPSQTRKKPHPPQSAPLPPPYVPMALRPLPDAPLAPHPHPTQSPPPYAPTVPSSLPPTFRRRVPPPPPHAPAQMSSLPQGHPLHPISRPLSLPSPKHHSGMPTDLHGQPLSSLLTSSLPPSGQENLYTQLKVTETEAENVYTEAKKYPENFYTQLRVTQVEPDGVYMGINNKEEEELYYTAMTSHSLNEEQLGYVAVGEYNDMQLNKSYGDVRSFLPSNGRENLYEYIGPRI